jgi:hypothetical protein
LGNFDVYVSRRSSTKKPWSPPINVGPLLLLSFYASSVSPAVAVSPVKLRNWSGTFEPVTDSFSQFQITGAASHLGRFTAHGEVEFLPVGNDGLLMGAGPVVFTAANGDLLVGMVTWDVGAEADDYRPGRLHISWRDSVTFNDGTLITNTGRFIDSRPPGLVVIAIIGVLVALLLPAVQNA